MKDVKETRSRLLTSTVLPLAVVAAMGIATPAFADSHGDGGACGAEEACGACGACGACAPCGADGESAE